MYKDIAATSDGTMFYDMWQLIIVLVRKCKGSMCIFMLVEGECVMFACRNVLPCTTLKGHSFELTTHIPQLVQSNHAFVISIYLSP